MKKKGFTLIELMIVLAVIAILAVVLIPKAGSAKNNAKNAGVTTNVNAVRAALEPKTGANFISSETTLASYLSTAFNSATADAANNLVNPFSNDYSVNGTNQPAIYVSDTDLTVLTNYKGSVVVISGANSYKVYGVDNGGTKVDEVTISK